SRIASGRSLLPRSNLSLQRSPSDGTARQPRNGVMMQVLVKHDGKWIVVAAQNTNASEQTQSTSKASAFFGRARSSALGPSDTVPGRSLTWPRGGRMRLPAAVIEAIVAWTRKLPPSADAPSPLRSRGRAGAEFLERLLLGLGTIDAPTLGRPGTRGRPRLLACAKEVIG